MSTILEWRDAESCYPFETDNIGRGILADAIFVQFDGFIPILDFITVDSINVSFSIIFDDGPKLINVPIDHCIDQQIIDITFNNRYYGTLIFDIGIESLAPQTNTKLTINTPFNGMTITSIPSTAGVFSINGITESVALVPDYINRLSTVSTGDLHNITWSAVSLPTDVDSITFDPNATYLVSENGLLTQLQAGATTILTQLPDKYTSLLLTDSKLLASKGSILYDLTSLPPTLLVSLPEKINTLTKNADHIIAISDSSFYFLPLNNPTTYPTTYTITGSVNKNAQAGVALVSGILTTCFIGTGISEMFYLNQDSTASVNGLFTIDGNTNLPQIQSLVTINNVTYGLYNDVGATTIFTLDTTLGVGSVVNSVAIDPTIGKYISIIGGSNISITINNLIPLKSINSVTPVNNTITLSTGDVLAITQSAQDELTLSLAPDIANTNIIHSTQYE